MRTAITALGVAVALTGCAKVASLGTPIPAANPVATSAERVDGDAAAAFASIGNLVNAAEAAKPDVIPQGEVLRSKAWDLFAAEHKLYASGVVGDITALQALVTDAKNLGN